MARTTATVLSIAAVTMIAILGLLMHDAVSERRTLAKRIAQLPSHEFRTVDGERFVIDDLPADLPVVLKFFHSSCEFCHNEASSIRSHSALQRHAAILMVSTEERQSIREFSRVHSLDEADRLYVVQDSLATLAGEFGVSRVPQTFIYGADRHLKKHFRGVTGAGAIYRVLLEQQSRPEEGGAADLIDD